MSVPAVWVVGLLVALEPQSPWQGSFEKTAEAFARVAESDPLFEEKGEERTAALLVSLAWYESRFRPNAVSSNGQYFCLLQIDKRYLPNPQKALDDPEACARAAIKILKNSLAKCAGKPLGDRLAVYVSGSCDHGIADSRYRTFLANKLLREHPVPHVEGGGTARAR